MKTHPFQLADWHRRSLYLTGLTLLLTGAVWTWIHRLDEAREASDAMRSLKPWLLAAHGSVAPLFALLVGALIPVHVRVAWNAGRNRGTGMVILGVMGTLILSGHALYYVGGETWRNGLSWFHLVIGLAAPILLAWHIRAGRRAS